MTSDYILTRRELELQKGIIELWMQKFWNHPLIYDWKAEIDWTLTDRIWISAKVINEEGPTREPDMDYLWLKHPVPIFHWTAYNCSSANEFASKHMKPEVKPTGLVVQMMLDLTRIVSDFYVHYAPDANEKED